MGDGREFTMDEAQGELAQVVPPVSIDAALDAKLRELRKNRDSLKSALQAAEEELDLLEAGIISAMHQAGQKSVKLASGLQLIVGKYTSYRTNAADRPAQVAWVEENGMKEILCVNFQTWNGVMKERAEAGLELPPFVFKHEEDRLSVRGAK